MFGDQTALPDGGLPHKRTGLADVIHLGLTPITLDTVIIKTIVELNHLCLRSLPPVQPDSDLLGIWEQAKDLIKARALGIHRLITSEKQAFRKHLQDRYNIRCQHKHFCPKKALLGQPMIPLNTSNDQFDPITTNPCNPLRYLILCKGELCSRIQQSFNETGDTSKRPMAIPKGKPQCYKCAQHQAGCLRVTVTLRTLLTNTDNKNAEIYHFWGT